MKTILITPPILDIQGFLMPTLSVPRLYTYLKEKKYAVSQINIEDNLSYYLFSKDNLELLFARIEELLLPKAQSDQEISADIKQRILTIVAKDKYLTVLFDLSRPDNLLKQILAIKIILTELIIDAMNNFKQPYKQLEPSSLSLWKLGALLISLAYYPVALDYNSGLLIEAAPLKTSSLLKSIADRDVNFLIPYYENQLIPELIKQRPQIIGVSIMIQSQFIPAFTLLNLIKKNLPEVKIIVGGVLISVLKEFFLNQPAVWEFFDYLCAGPGEYALEGLILSQQNKISLSAVPNIIYRDKDKFVINKHRALPMNEAATPEFTQADSRFLLPLQITNGCYWHKCEFCAYNSFEPQKLSIRSIDLIIKDIQALVNKNPLVFIAFVDGAVPPKTALEFAQALIEKNIKIKYSLRMRAEEFFLEPKICRIMADSGCQAIYLALESGAQRINDLSHKGINIINVEKILANFYEAGIRIFLHIIVGFPSETKEEILATRDFIKRNSKYITGAPIISPFNLWQGIPLLKKAAEYQISNIQPKNWCRDFPLEYDYTINNGLQPDEIFSLYNNIYNELKIAEPLPKFGYLEYIGSLIKS